MTPKLLVCILTLVLVGCSSLDLYRAVTNEQIAGDCGARYSSFLYNAPNKFSVNVSVSRIKGTEKIYISILVPKGKSVRLTEPYFSVVGSDGQVSHGSPPVSG